MSRSSATSSSPALTSEISSQDAATSDSAPFDVHPNAELAAEAYDIVSLSTAVRQAGGRATITPPSRPSADDPNSVMASQEIARDAVGDDRRA
jgi:hypothetical protein